MENINSTVRLKNAIQLLELEQVAKGKLLKEKFYISLEILKPVNLLKSSWSDITTSPLVFDNILGTLFGLATGYLSKRLVVGKSVNRYRKLIGTVLQLGITKFISKNPAAVRSFGQSVFQRIFRRKEQQQ